MRRPRLALAASLLLLAPVVSDAFASPGGHIRRDVLRGTSGAGSNRPFADRTDGNGVDSSEEPARNASGRRLSAAVGADDDDDGGEDDDASPAVNGVPSTKPDWSTPLSPSAPRPSFPPDPSLRPMPPRRRSANGKTFRMKVFSFLNQPPVEVLSSLAVLLSSFLVALDTLDDLPPVPAVEFLGWESIDSHYVIDGALDVINVIFAVDFFVRWYAAGNFKPRYLTKPLVGLDIVVVLVPLFLGNAVAGIEHLFHVDNLPSIPRFGDNAGLQNLLLLRILRLRRVLTDVNTFSRFQSALGMRRNDARPYQLQLARVSLSVFTLLSVASGLIYTAEHEVNDSIPDYFAALYFGLTTLTTVGFGDIAPVTPEGRLVVCAAIVAGVAVIPAQAANLVDAVLAFNEERKRGGPRVTIRAAPAPGSEKSDGTAAASSSSSAAGRGRRASSSSLRAAAAEDARRQRRRARDDVRASSSSEATAEGEEAGGTTTTAAPSAAMAKMRRCLRCEATDHREDASYCWSCGSSLYPPRPREREPMSRKQ